MINFRIIARVFSLVLIIEGFFMLLSGVVSLLYREPATLVFSAIITIVSGALVFTPLRDEEKLSGNKEGFIIISGIWLIMSIYGTIPYLLSGTAKSFTDAFFESMSGFTTTGATILADVESRMHGIIFWRSITQWLGGIGFIIISLSVLQVVKTINIPLTITDFTGQPTDKIHPRTKEVAKRLVTIYISLTIAEIILLAAGGMNFFDASCHSFSTISTGGFSTKNAGLSAFASGYIPVVLTLFMFLAGTNMTLVYFSLKKNFKKITGNNEFISYALTCLVFVIIGATALYAFSGYTPVKALRAGSFHVISFITTTGFYNEDYTSWSPFMTLIIFMIMFTGGSAVSASGGLKIIRLLLMTRNARHEMKRMIHPSAFIPVRLDQKRVTLNAINNMLVFILIYLILVCLGSFLISLTGYDITSSFSASASMLGNIGPAMGSFGPFSTCADAPASCKWILSFLMLAGRLELFSLLILFTRSFYRR
jgi:trk system potassium uptake protein TrkH